MEFSTEALCVACLTPCVLSEAVVAAAVAGRMPTTFYCDDDLAILGVGIPRPEGTCACGGSQLIVPVRWRRG